MDYACTSPLPDPPATPPTLVWKLSRETQRFPLELYRQSLRQFDLGKPHFISEVHRPIETPRQNVQFSDSRLLLYFPSDQHAQPAHFLLYIDLIIAFLFLVPTLGIPKLYYSLFRYNYNPMEAPENRVERGYALPSLPIYPRWDGDTFDRIASIWSATFALSSAGVLTSVMGFFQLLSVRNNVVFTSLVVGACVLTWSSTLCCLLFTGYKQSFLTRRIAVQWECADSPHCPFWRLVALPVTLLAWGVLFCFIATIYISFTGFNNDQPTAAPLRAVGGLFVLGISAISGSSIYNAARSLGILGFE